MNWLENLLRRSDDGLEGQRAPSNNEGMLNVAEFSFTRKSDVGETSQRTKLLGTLTGLTTRRGARFAKAVTTVVEVATGAGLQGSIRFTVDDLDDKQCVVAEICVDSDLFGGEHVLKTNCSHNSSQSGKNAPQICEQDLPGVRALVDRFDMRFTETNCVVYLAQVLPKGAVPLAEDDVVNWSELLEAGTPAKALAQAQRQMRRLSAEFSVQQKDRPQEPTSESISAGSVTYELLSRVVSDTTNSIAIIDRAGCVEWANSAFEELTGYSSEEASGMPFETFLFDKESDPKWVSRMRRMLADGKAVSGERMQRRRDGKQYCCTFNISPLHESDGTLAGWVDIGWDTTSSRNTRQELERATRNAEMANRAKSEFLANMSHEIRTPMNTILGMTELALETKPTEQQAEYLSAVKDSARSLLEILNDILDLSKIEAQRLDLEDIDFNLAHLLRESMRPLSLEAERKGIKLAWDVSQDVPQDLRGDPTRLRQVLLNLVSNAIKFTSRGGVDVVVEKQWSSAGQVGLQLSVRDSGIGIPPDRLIKIFEAFTQVDSSTTRQFGGTGLGLTITAELLRLMHGRIWVESEIGKGSTFYCTVRLHVAKRPVRSQPEFGDEYSTGRDVRSLNILIADDHYPNRQLIQSILRKHGHTFREADSGREVLKCLAHEKFDVVLMDVQMPEIDGFEATAAIRAAERETYTHQPIIGVTAYAMKGDCERCLLAGMDAYLAKPIESMELIRLIETLVSATPVSEAVPIVASTWVPKGREQATEVSERGSSPIDFAPALERLAGDVDLLKRQMSFFLDDAPKLVAQLSASIDSGNFADTKVAAHRLKGLVSSYDRHNAALLAQKLEQCAASNQLADAPPLALALAGDVDRLIVAIRDFLTQNMATDRGI